MSRMSGCVNSAWFDASPAWLLKGFRGLKEDGKDEAQAGYWLQGHSVTHLKVKCTVYATLIDITGIRGSWWHFWLPPAGKISFIGPDAQALSSKKILVQMSGCANLQLKMCDLILILTDLIFFCYFEANSCLRDSFYRMFSIILKSQDPYWQRLSEPFLESS